jgi:hypothetical protein
MARHVCSQRSGSSSLVHLQHLADKDRGRCHEAVEQRLADYELEKLPKSVALRRLRRNFSIARKLRSLS